MQPFQKFPEKFIEKTSFEDGIKMSAKNDYFQKLLTIFGEFSLRNGKRIGLRLRSQRVRTPV